MQSYRNNTNIVHQSAIKIADKGKPVFPCREDKRPYTRNGFHDATTDRSKITAFWKRYPGAKIGMPTGDASGILVIDTDVDESKELEGEADLRQLEREYQELPRTRTIKTPRGGRHRYFRAPVGTRSRRIAAAVELKANGQYVIVPPSDGYKVVDNSPIADAPDWLLEALRDEPRKPSGPVRSRPGLPGIGEPIPEGSRNRTLFFEALDLKDEGLHRDNVLATTLKANEERCQPPLPETEVEKIVKSAMRYPVRSGKASPEVTEFCDLLEDMWWSWLWSGVAAKTARDVLRVLIELASRYGRLTADGKAIEVSASVRTLSIAAACSFPTISRTTKKYFYDNGLALIFDPASGTRDGARWRLLLPANSANQPANTQHSSGRIEGRCLSVSTVITPRQRDLKDLQTPAFRWQGLVGKGRAGLLYMLEAYGPMSDYELADRLGVSYVGNVRRYLKGYDDKRRGVRVRGLLDLGLVQQTGDKYALFDNHAERVEEVRNTKYARERKRKQYSPEENRTITVVDPGVAASEVEREAKDIRDHERDREKYWRYLVELQEAASTSFYDLGGELAEPRAEPAQVERRRPSPRIAEPKEPHPPWSEPAISRSGELVCRKHHVSAHVCEECSAEVHRLIRQGYKHRFAVEDMYLTRGVVA
jgi:Bifunctional DNA primase/polymerase, N-terminal/Primase C terminal 1 (PriCT-1)